MFYVRYVKSKVNKLLFSLVFNRAWIIYFKDKEMIGNGTLSSSRGRLATNRNLYS